MSIVYLGGRYRNSIEVRGVKFIRSECILSFLGFVGYFELS